MTQQQPPSGFVLDTEETGAAPPEGFVLDSPATPRDDINPEVADKPGFFQSFSEWFSGQDRSTRDLAATPTIIEAGFLQGESIGDIATIAFMTQMTNDPDELANIIQKQLPHVRVQYNKDAQGNIYPILVNPNNGLTAIVDRPGADIMNLGQFASQAAAFSFGGGSGGAVKIGLMEAGRETVLQGVQTAAGGDFDVGDVAMSGILGSGTQLLGDATGFAFRAYKGKPLDEVQGLLAASDEFNIPVLTSDIYNPKNWFERGIQITSEWLPVVGTGGLRHAQQEARERALQDFVSLYRGGSYEEVVRQVGLRNKEMKDAAGAVYNRINPYLDQISSDGGIPLTSARQKLDELTEYLTAPGREVEGNALSLLDDLDEAFSGGYQSFQVVKDNIGAWSAKMDSLDPKARVNDSNVKRKFQEVLQALRSDRDSFAQANLSDADFLALKKADETWAHVIDDMSQQKLKAIFQRGDATPEVIRGALFSRNKSDIQRLFENLNPEGQAAARAAFITEIASDLAKQEKGLSPSSFATRMNRYQDGIDVLFPGSRKDEVNGFVNLLRVTDRAQKVERGAGSETFERFGGVGAIGSAGATLAGAVPPEAFASYVGVGALARLFESPKVRSILVKANGLAPGSTEMQQLGQQFNDILRASLQANPLKGTTEFERELSEEFKTREAEAD